MMNVSYDEYIEESALCLAEALDYAANSCQMDVEVFLEMFIISGYAKKFEGHDAAVVFGLSGTELVCRSVEESGLYLNFPPAVIEFDIASLEYWTGYFLAYLSYYSGKSIRNIMDNISMEEFSGYVPDLMDSDEELRKDKLLKLLSFVEDPVRLQELRKECGYSQRELALKSGVNLRTLQQYEIRAKDINKAAASTLKALADVLGCEITDLMEN